MNIKSLLLGSAAALIAVSGARAADAVVVAEPEPAEYVKICERCGQRRLTFNAQFRENISYFFERRERAISAQLCFPCTAKVYGVFTGRTLVGTWWGIIGMFYGPVVIVSNTLWFLGLSCKFVFTKR